MPIPDQLEIITAAGAVEFYTLDPAKGITNIGRHPDNDIVIDSPNVPLFHAILDHRHRPYQVMSLGEEVETQLDGQRLAPNVSTVLPPSGTLEVDGHTLILVEGSSTGALQAAAASATGPPPAPAPHAAPPPAPAPAPVITTPAPAPPAPPPPSLQPRPAARPLDQPDECIIVELPEREWTIDVEQTAAFTVTIANGGPIVATFFVGVEWVGRPDPAADSSAPEWVDIIPAQVNLNEGEREAVTISLTPPRHPSSRAGAHHLAVVVTSPDYPGRVSRMGATLFINPYYEFGMGELSPKQQTLGGRNPSGETQFDIANKGNCEAAFRLEATDDEHACSFEFRVPGETATLARQAEMRLPPEETFTIPVKITPLSRPLIGLRKRTHSFTVNATMLEGQLTPRSLLGQVKVRPLIGPALIALMLLFLATVVIMIFNPSIDTFEADLPAVEAGTPVALYWEASAFANLNIQGIGEVPRRSGRVTVVPLEPTVYRLEADNWLSGLNPWFGDSRELPVAVTPVRPVIRVFEVSPQEIIRGDSVVLRWEVIGAERLVLKINEAPQELLSDEHTSQRQLTPDGTTTYVLEAYNRYTDQPVADSKTVQVVNPTSTPVPTPHIEFFQVEPNEVTLGEKVTFDWSVTGFWDRVQLDPIGPVDQVGPTVYEPEREGTLSFWLRAFNGAAEAWRLQKVLVRPAPIPPKIESFAVQPDEIVRGDDRSVQLYWLVSGDVSDIQISGPGFGPVTSLPKEGSLPVTADETTFFVLTVLGMSEDQTASATVELTVLEPTPLPTATPTSTPTPVPPIISFFNAEENDQVVLVGGGTYQVDHGSPVNLRWRVQNADTLTLISFLAGPEDQDPLSDGKTISSVTEPDEYTLKAVNAGGTVMKSLAIQLKLPDPPPPPSGVSGETGAGANKITWSYGQQDENKIVGFRVYRADVPPGDNFRRVADVGVLDAGSREWVDDLGSGNLCGKTYYVVAVYEDIYGVLQETDASSTSWSSQPCPTPTPAPG
jgi:hypothetical protein